MVEGSPSKIAAHALVGGLKSMAMGGDFKTGALAGGANEALIGYLAKLALPEGYDPNKPGAEQAEANLLAMSQLLGVLTAVVSGSDPRIAADIAANATQNNFLNHTENAERLEAVKRCNNGDMQACARRDELNLLDVNRDKAVWAACDGAARSPACTAARTEAQIARFDLLRHLDTPEARAQLEQDLKDPDLNFTVLGELRSIKLLDDAIVRQISTSIGKNLFSIGLDLSPGVGDMKAIIEADDGLDYLFATIGLVPGLGDGAAHVLKEARDLIKAGSVKEADALLDDFADTLADAKVGANDLEGSIPTGTKPDWLKRLEAGNEFNTVQNKNYPYSEVYVNRPDGNGYYRVDSYDPDTGEIISRKFTQLSDVSEKTATKYIQEAITKYPPGATVAKVPSSGELGGQKLQGSLILEVPPQVKGVPKSILDAATKAGVVIRDSNGKVY